MRPSESPPAGRRSAPLLDLLGVRPPEFGGGKGRAELVVSPQHLRSLGIIHGGVVAMLLDTALGVAAGSVAPEGHDVVTAQLNVNFIRPARVGETLVATGEVRHAGRRTAVAWGEIRNDGGDLVAAASGTFMYLPHADPALGGIARPDADAPPANLV